MKVPLGWLVSWALYWLGDGISIVMDNRYLHWLYPAYNRVMLASNYVQDWAGCDGPWVEDEDEAY